MYCKHPKKTTPTTLHIRSHLSVV